MPSAVREPRRDAPLDPIFIEVRAAAQLLNLSKTEVHRLLKDGVIESHVHGRRRLVSLASVRQFASELPMERTGTG